MGGAVFFCHLLTDECVFYITRQTREAYAGHWSVAKVLIEWELEEHFGSEL